MARPLRIEFPGAIYHVTCRMLGDGRLERSRLFVDDRDRERFLERLADRVSQYNVRLYLFVCMTNHFHVVFETPEANCSSFMQSLCTAYTVYYNLRHARHGHLLDGRYKAKLVEGEENLLALTRYVHLNPVQVGGMKDRAIEERIRYLREYPWSSYPSYMGGRKRLDFVEYGPVLAEMGGKAAQRPRRYREFVETGLAEDDEDFEAALRASPRSIGGGTFRAWVDERYQGLVDTHRRPEDVSFRHTTEPLPAETILAVLSEALRTDTQAFLCRRRNSPLRAMAARMLIRFGGLTQRDAARYLHMGTGGAVSAQLRKLPGLLTAGRKLERTLRQVEKTLQALKGTKRDRSVSLPERDKC